MTVLASVFMSDVKLLGGSLYHILNTVYENSCSALAL